MYDNIVDCVGEGTFVWSNYISNESVTSVLN